MKIFVEAKPRSKEPCVERVDENHFKVLVKEPPEAGKANMAVMKALKEHFNVNWSDIRLVSGASSRKKVFEIERHGL